MVEPKNSPVYAACVCVFVCMCSFWVYLDVFSRLNGRFSIFAKENEYVPGVVAMGIFLSYLLIEERTVDESVKMSVNPYFEHFIW